jgi:Domain of unknown function (DUF4249)
MNTPFKYRNFFNWFIFSLFLSACTKEVNFTLPEEPYKLVLSCNPIASESLLAYVSFSTPSYATDTILQSFAPTLLLEKDGQPIETLKPVKGTYKYWKSTIKLEEGVAYSITVSAPNFPTISSSTIIPRATRLKPFLIDSNTFSYNQLNLDTTVLRVPLMIKPDKLAESDSFFAFRLKYQIVSPNLNESEQKATFIADGPTFVNLHESPDGTFLVDKKLWSNNPNAELPIDVLLPYNVSQTKSIAILLEWRTVSADYYKYYLSLSKQGNYGIIFSTPDVLYNNILNGYGNFSGFTRTQYTINVK